MWKKRGYSLAALHASHGFEIEAPVDRITVEDQEALAIAEAELKRMPIRHREAFLAKAGTHPENLSCRQVARRYRRSPAAVGKWVQKASQQLAVALEVRQCLT